MLRIWGRANSVNVQKVLWLADELGVEFEHVPAGGPYGRLDDPEFRALNPFGKVPAIDDDGVAVWESHAICRYLAERYGGERWWPSAAGRARIEPWIDWHQTTLQPPLVGGLFWGYFRTPEPQRNWQAIRQSEATCAALLQFVDGVLADRAYLAGDELTLADIPLGTCLYRYFEIDVRHADAPNVRRWYARLCERPAYQQHVMQSFEELRGRLAF